MSTGLLLLVIAGPLVGAALALTRTGPRSAGRPVVAGTASAAVAALGLLVLAGVDTAGRVDGVSWLGLGVTRPGAILAVLVAATAAVIASFSQRNLDADGRAPRYFAFVGLVACGSMLVVVQGGPALLLVGWIASGWALVGLVGFIDGWQPAIDARRRIARTLLVGDMALLGAVVVGAWASDGLLTGTGTSGGAVAQLSERTIGGVTALHVVALLVVVAGASRSAMLPFHRWLHGTLLAPTPVSALVHAGLVSGAGLLLLRFADVVVRSGPAVVLAFVLGVATVLVASSAMVMRADTKGSLAWSTVAQMAFMVIQCSVGAFSSAVFHIAGHGMYKAALFLGAGDTASAGLRARRRPTGHPPVGRRGRMAVSAALATIAVGAAVAVIGPVVSDAGLVLIVVFAWLSVAFAVDGWLAQGPLAKPVAVAVAAAGALVSAFGYVAGLRLVEDFVAPSLASVPSETVIGPVEVGLVIGFVALAAVLVLVPRFGSSAAGRLWRRLVLAAVEPRPPRVGNRADGTASTLVPDGTRDPVRLAEIRADGAKAAAIIAPQWPLASFVAVNPLDGLESLGFDEAAAVARRSLGARTHLSLEDFRADHRAGHSSVADLEHVVCYRFTELCEADPIDIAGRPVSPVEIIVADLLDGPDQPEPPSATTRLGSAGEAAGPWTALIDDVVSGWLAAYVEGAHGSGPQEGERFVAFARRHLLDDPRLAALLEPGATEWLIGLGTDPAEVIDAALAANGIADVDRIEELRAQLARLPGWAGLAKWRNEWAHPDEERPPLAPIDIAAVRVALEALVLASRAVAVDPTPTPTPATGTEADPELVAARVGAVGRSLGGADHSIRAEEREAIAAILARVPAQDRASLWLAAQERRFEERILGMVERLDPGPTIDRPDAQLVFCIDVRSEGFRRHLEAAGNVQTLGFAGFFGVPMRLRRLGWDHDEARCPVLVAPAITATEHPRHEAIGPLSAQLAGQRVVGGIESAHTSTKYGLGAPFTMAETVGWVTGPLAAAKTLRPGRASAPEVPPTRLVLDDDEILLEQRVFFAEAVLRTMGLTDRFAPTVVLCGHTSITTNNPHATALECGACAGASGGDNARAVAALLNAPDVRHGLVERGITIPDDTWFLAGLHDTASDRVSLLDTADAPPTHEAATAVLRAQLELAGRAQASDRARLLPGPAVAVRDRGADWAQVRPEWGLAGNAAFIIGPRSMTAGLDLEGRAFLHEYDESADPTGRVLETIMTAPLVVGHWISSQYYFSTVDPERFGAGDKLVHNPIGTTGVLAGDRGDLRVGLPLQSTHVDGRRHHQPLRLLAIIQADLERIETIIAANPILQSLTSGSWLRIAGRSHHHEPWSSRTPEGTWIASPRPTDPPSTLTPTPGPTPSRSTEPSRRARS